MFSKNNNRYLNNTVLIFSILSIFVYNTSYSEDKAFIEISNINKKRDRRSS